MSIFDTIDIFDEEEKISLVISESIMTTINYINSLKFDNLLDDCFFIDPYRNLHSYGFDEDKFIILEKEKNKIKNTSKLWAKSLDAKYNDKILIVVNPWDDSKKTLSKFIDENINNFRTIIIFDTVYSYAIKQDKQTIIKTTSSYYMYWKGKILPTRTFSLALNPTTDILSLDYIFSAYPNFEFGSN